MWISACNSGGILPKRRHSCRGSVVAGRSSLYAGCGAAGVGQLSLVGRTWHIRLSSLVRQQNHRLGHACRIAGLVSGPNGAYGDVAATEVPPAAIAFSVVAPVLHLFFSKAGVAAGGCPHAHHICRSSRVFFRASCVGFACDDAHRNR